MPRLLRRILKILLGVVIAIVVIGVYGAMMERYYVSGAPMRPPAVPSAHPIVTLAKAKRVRGGMSYQQVVAIVGVPGKPVSRFRWGPLPPFTPRPKDSPEYEWRNSDGSYLTVTFHNGEAGMIEEIWLR